MGISSSGGSVSLRLLPILALTGGLLNAATLDTPIIAFNLGPTLNATLPQFDPSLGTLTGITLFYNNVNLTQNANVASIVGAGTSSIFADFTTGADVTLPNIPEIQPLVQLFQNFGCSASGKEFNSCSDSHFITSGPLAGSMSISPSPDMSSYIGLSTVAVGIIPFADIANIVSNPTASDPIGTNVFLDTTQESGNLFLEYTYTPASVSTPEPASLGLSLVGLALVGFGVFRRKRS